SLRRPPEVPLFPALATHPGPLEDRSKPTNARPMAPGAHTATLLGRSPFSRRIQSPLDPRRYPYRHPRRPVTLPAGATPIAGAGPESEEATAMHRPQPQALGPRGSSARTEEPPKTLPRSVGVPPAAGSARPTGPLPHGSR